VLVRSLLVRCVCVLRLFKIKKHVFLCCCLLASLFVQLFFLHVLAFFFFKKMETPCWYCYYSSQRAQITVTVCAVRCMVWIVLIMWIAIVVICIVVDILVMVNESVIMMRMMVTCAISIASVARRVWVIQQVATVVVHRGHGGGWSLIECRVHDVVVLEVRRRLAHQFAQHRCGLTHFRRNQRWVSLLLSKCGDFSAENFVLLVELVDVTHNFSVAIL